MATSDGESCSAEDRALAIWSDGGLASSTTLEGAFRDGFRAGQEHGKPCEQAHADGWNYRQAVAKGWNAALESTRKQLEQMKDGAQAGKPPTVHGYSRIDDELSKIRDRLNALERRPEPDHRGRFMGIERSVEHLRTELARLDVEFRSMRSSIGALETKQVATEHQVAVTHHARLDTIESKLRLLEPIG